MLSDPVFLVLRWSCGSKEDVDHSTLEDRHGLFSIGWPTLWIVELLEEWDCGGFSTAAGVHQSYRYF